MKANMLSMMKTLREKYVILVWLFILSMSVLNIGYANITDEGVPLDGTWHGKTRSISQIIPVSAYIQTNTLYIQNSILNTDITVTIENNNGVQVFQQTYSASQTSYIVIPLSDLETGAYTLELSNPWGGYLLGGFVI